MASAPNLHLLAPSAPTPVADRLGPNNAFIGACADFDDLITKLQALRALHFGVDTDENAQRNWTEALRVAAMNQRIAEGMAFITGTAK